METLEDLKAIRDSAMKFNKASSSKVKGIKIFDGWYRWFLDDNSYSKIFDNDAFDDVMQIERSLSDIERIIELMDWKESHNGEGKHKTNLLIDAEKLLRDGTQEHCNHLADVIEGVLK